VGGWMAASCPPSRSLIHLLNRTGGENKMRKLMGEDKDREITYLLRHGKTNMTSEKLI